MVNVAEQTFVTTSEAQVLLVRKVRGLATEQAVGRTPADECPENFFIGVSMVIVLGSEWSADGLLEVAPPILLGGKPVEKLVDRRYREY